MEQTTIYDRDPEYSVVAGHYYMDSSYRGLWHVEARDGDDVVLRNVDTGFTTTQALDIGPGDRPDETCEGTPWFDLPGGGNVRVFAHRHVGGPDREFATFRNRHRYTYLALFFGDQVEKVTVRRRAELWRDPWDHSQGTYEAEVVKLLGVRGYHEVYRDVTGDEMIWLGEYKVSARDEVAA